MRSTHIGQGVIGQACCLDSVCQTCLAGSVLHVHLPLPTHLARLPLSMPNTKPLAFPGGRGGVCTPLLLLMSLLLWLQEAEAEG